MENILLYAGGPGSGCKGPNCGRPHGFIGNIDEGKIKGMAKLTPDPDEKGRTSDSFWVAPNGDVHKEADVVGPGFHEHWVLAKTLADADPKRFAWLKKASDDASKTEKGFGWKYAFVGNAIKAGGIRVYIASGGHADYDAGIEVHSLDRKTVNRIQTLVDSLPTDDFRVDWNNGSDGKSGSAEGNTKEIMRQVRKAAIDDGT